MNINEYISRNSQYQRGLTMLHDLIVDLRMTPTIKWGIPVYTWNGKNLVGLSAFKSYFGLWFYQGALLTDTNKVLINAQEGKTQAMRQWRFTTHEDIDLEIVKKYVQEAINNQQAGKEIKPAKKPLIIPDELKTALKTNTNLADAFENLSPSCQREYADYINEAKRATTKLSRLEKIKPMIVEKKGLNDQYK